MNKQFWSRRIREVEPYVPGEQPKDRTYVKLNTNENPYPPSPKVQEALQKVEMESLRLYPDPDCYELRCTLAQQQGLVPQQVFVGNGSDEILAFSYLAFMDNETPAIFPDITYSFYPVYAAFFGNNTRIVPVNEDFTMPLEQLGQDDGTLIITNPNAPTGIALPLSDIADLCRRNPNHVVIVDEAYVDFGAESAVKLLAEYPNLLVIQTCSKSRALAGMRIGFAFGSEDLIAALNTVKNSINSYTLDRMALAAANAAIGDKAYTDDTCRRVAETREKTTGKLKELGFTVLPSQANFIFASHPSVPGEKLFLGLRQRGVLVRYFRKPRIDNFLRITIGTDQEMNVLLDAVKEILEEYHA
jgi:histidinol-phosphate aminotransferase